MAGSSGHARDQRDDHAEASDDAEFGDADIVGREERAECEEYRACRKREWRAERLIAARCERHAGIRALEPLGVEADRDLNSKIDAEPHEQRE